MLKVFTITSSHKMGLCFIVWFHLNSESVKFNLESPLVCFAGIPPVIIWRMWDEGLYTFKKLFKYPKRFDYPRL